MQIFTKYKQYLKEQARTVLQTDIAKRAKSVLEKHVSEKGRHIHESDAKSTKVPTSVTVFPSNTKPEAYNTKGIFKPATTPEDIFRHGCEARFFEYPEAKVYLSSFREERLSQGDIYPSSDGFIRGAIDAWAQHQHLVIRPDEVWFAILVQMNFYMTKNAEKLRHLFVNHEGKETILIEVMDSIEEEIETILNAFREHIHGRVKTTWLRDWIMPQFTTTTSNDTLTASVLMMGMMQQYFEYHAGIICGFPSVTLLGEKADWVRLLEKLERLPDFGAEPVHFAGQLRPILKRFVRTYDEPDSPEIRAFWNSMVFAHDRGACGLPPYNLEGWLSGFFFWDAKGVKKRWFPQSTYECITLDGISYPSIALERLPVGYAQAPVILHKFGGRTEFPSYVVAGNLAKQFRSGPPEGYAQALKRHNGSNVDETAPHGQIQPLPGWLLYGPADKPAFVDVCEPPQEDQRLYKTLDNSRWAFCDQFPSSRDNGRFTIPQMLRGGEGGGKFQLCPPMQDK